MSWKVPSGSVLRIVIGSMPASSSFMAMSMGFVFSAASTKIGAPIEICSALAPTILAFSKRVIFGGPTMIFWLDVFSTLRLDIHPCRPFHRLAFLLPAALEVSSFFLKR